MTRVFSRFAFVFVFAGLFFLIPPFTDQSIEFLSGNFFIFSGFFIYMIGCVLTAVSIVKNERSVMSFVNIIGVLIGMAFVGFLMMSTGAAK
ncbi:MAG: hypothetical protein RR603_06515 [Kurthia sp.]|uniref:Uncharacterized protein n=1 Tax=Kurthia zopfii TaxID=1650 RepID=A0A2U3AF37_9BACL|nr:hypothetical protein [Kurthia zopfii]PWI23137.1 hypothetical protein DF281_03685 [Kurthia zopfii]TDR41315.1 hypothetical protein DFR61_1068 [Kurthia zopfii]STX09820.1 Uncharacterised protein [Kurthia zopfii]VEI07198.1 Uncharacterised protein [Kurthia zopfii]GEK29957.1 hypothetical protein KZO01_02660 [Kurthia zopfii]